MENMEDVLMELNNFGKKAPESISPVLENYLTFVAKTGTTLFPWVKIKPLFKVKLQRVIDEFSPNPEDLPAVPNVDQFCFSSCREKVFQQLDCFNGIPFTVQRLCELLTAPKKHYKRTDKFMRALEKNMLIVSTVEPRFVRQSTEDEVEEGTTTLVNGGDHHHKTSTVTSRLKALGNGGEPEKRSSLSANQRHVSNGVAESSTSSRMEVDAEDDEEEEDEEEEEEDEEEVESDGKKETASAGEKDDSGPCDSGPMEDDDSNSSSDSSSERVSNVPSSSEGSSDAANDRSLTAAADDLVKSLIPANEEGTASISGSEESSGPCDSGEASAPLPASADSDDSSSSSTSSPSPTATPTLDSSTRVATGESIPQQPSSSEEDAPSSDAEKMDLSKKKDQPMEEGGPCDSGELETPSDSSDTENVSTTPAAFAEDQVQSTSPTKTQPEKKSELSEAATPSVPEVNIVEAE